MVTSIIFLLIGFLYIALGFPLYRGKVKRNEFYGFRVQKTLSDDKYWFPANKVAGKYLMISGVATVAIYIIMSFFISDEMCLLWTMVATILLGTLGSVIMSYRYLKTLN